MFINVTQHHIDNGYLSNEQTHMNPVELAILEHEGVTTVIVIPFGVSTMFLNGQETNFEVPVSVSDYLWDYDDGDEIYPMYFDVELS